MRSLPGVVAFIAGLTLVAGCGTGPDQAVTVTVSKPIDNPPAEVAAITVGDTDWPWWRGPRVDGTFADAKIPTTWSPSENVLWKTPIPGKGHSTPIVIGQKVFLTTAVDQGQVQSLVCLDLKSGTLLWNTPLHAGQFAKIHPDNSQASATPASDGQYVYAVFGNKNGVFLSAVDLDGQLIWAKECGPYPSEHGYSQSVCVHGDVVIVAGEAVRTGFLAAFDRATGAEVWRKPRTPHRQHANYASPIIAQLGGRPQLIVGGWNLVSSYDPATGELLWENPGPADVNANAVAVQDPYLIVSGGYPQKNIICIKTDEPDGAKGRKVLWESTRNVSWVPTPLIHDGRVLMLADNGVLSDLDLQTGEAVWTQRLTSDAYSSPIRVGDTFMATTRDGVTHVFKSTDKFEKIAANSLDEDGGNATPVVIGDTILIRTDRRLFRIGQPSL